MLRATQPNQFSVSEHSMREQKTSYLVFGLKASRHTQFLYLPNPFSDEAAISHDGGSLGAARRRGQQLPLGQKV